MASSQSDPGEAPWRNSKIIPRPGDWAPKIRSANMEKVKGKFGSNRRKFALFSANSRRN
jgi:hypothetical protein